MLIGFSSYSCGRYKTLLSTAYKIVDTAENCRKIVDVTCEDYGNFLCDKLNSGECTEEEILHRPAPDTEYFDLVKARTSGVIYTVTAIQYKDSKPTYEVENLATKETLILSELDMIDFILRHDVNNVRLVWRKSKHTGLDAVKKPIIYGKGCNLHEISGIFK